MNIELLKKVRDAIADEENPIGFDMGHFFCITKRCTSEKSIDGMIEELERSKGCGTTACIAGHAVAVALKTKMKLPALGYESISLAARNLLELTPQQAEYLFVGYWSQDGILVNKEETLAYLDKVIERGHL